jgi:SAM-dependent methyltransferase
MFAKPYAKYYDLLNGDKPYKREIEFIYKWAGRPKWIFDIGCGTGSYWKYYPKRTEILGIDKSPDMAAHRPGSIICSDIRSYRPKAIFDCATALFDVINYIPVHDWWKNIPIAKGGYFIFDIWDKRKVDKENFRSTVTKVNGVSRLIVPLGYDGKKVDLKITVYEYEDLSFVETHRMYLYSHEDILGYAELNGFKFICTRPTRKWQIWYKLRKK